MTNFEFCRDSIHSKTTESCILLFLCTLGTANKKKGGGGGEEARGFTTVRGAPQNGDGRVEADFAMMRLTAQPRHKICIFFKGGAKNCSKTREVQIPADLLARIVFLASVVRHFLQS